MKNNFKKLGIKVLSMSLACFSLFGAINSAQAMGGRKGGEKKEAPSPMSARAEALSVKIIVEAKCNYGWKMECIFSDGTRCTAVMTLMPGQDYESLHNSMCLLFPNAKPVRDAKPVCAWGSDEKSEDVLLLPLGTQLKWKSGGKSQTLMTLKSDGSFDVHDKVAQCLLDDDAFGRVKNACAEAGIFKYSYDWGRQFKIFEEYFSQNIKKGGVLHRVLPDLPHVNRILLCVRLGMVEKESSEVEIMPMVELRMSNGDKPTYIFPKSAEFGYADVLDFMDHMKQLYPTAQVMIQETLGAQCYPFDMYNFNIWDIVLAEIKGYSYPDGFLITLTGTRADADKLKEEKARNKKEEEEEEKKRQEEEARKKKEKEEEEKIQAEEARKKRAEELSKAYREQLAREAEEQRRQEERAKNEAEKRMEEQKRREAKALAKEAKKESSEGSKESTSSDSSSSSASCEEKTEVPLTEEELLDMCDKKAVGEFNSLSPQQKKQALKTVSAIIANPTGFKKIRGSVWESIGAREAYINKYDRIVYIINSDGSILIRNIGGHLLEKK